MTASFHLVSSTTVIRSFYISFYCFPPPLCGHWGFYSGPLWFSCAWFSSLFTWHVKLLVCRPNVAHVNSFGSPWDFTKETINMAQRGKGNCDMKWFTSCYLQVLHNHTGLLCLQPSWMVWRHTWGCAGSQTIFRWKSSSGLTTYGWHRSVQTKRKLLAVFQVSGVLHNVGRGKQNACTIYLEETAVLGDYSFPWNLPSTLVRIFRPCVLNLFVIGQPESNYFCHNVCY